MWLHGIDVEPRDLDVLTTSDGAHEIASRLGVAAGFTERGDVRGVIIDLVIEGVAVEVLGDVSNRMPDGTWSPPAALDVVMIDGTPVMSRAALEAGYRLLGRHAKADLIATSVPSRGQ